MLRELTFTSACRRVVTVLSVVAAMAAGAAPVRLHAQARHRARLSGDLTERIRQRIEAQGILFKVKIIGAEMRERQNVPVPAKKAPIS